MIEVLGTVGMVCGAALIAQWQSHRFRASMRATGGELAVLEQRVSEAIAMLRTDLDNEKAKLTQLANRTR